jgi:hypothetical protein
MTRGHAMCMHACGTRTFDKNAIRIAEMTTSGVCVHACLVDIGWHARDPGIELVQDQRMMQSACLCA